MSRMHSIDVTKYITDEAKKFAEVLSDSFWGVDVKIKESYSSTKIHFNLHWSEYNLLLVIEEGIAYFLKRENQKPIFRRRKVAKTVIAEWNDFAEPIEAALSIQMKMYRAMKSCVLRENSYHCKTEAFETADEIKFEDFEDTDDSEDVEETDSLYSISDDIIGSQTHSIFNAEDFQLKSEDVLTPPFQEISDESYLDTFDDI